MLRNASLLFICLSVVACNIEPEPETEMSVDEWIELCEAQTSRDACDGVATGMRGDETWWCQHSNIVQADPTTCQFQRNDSRCFAASSPASGLDYVYTGADSGTWLVEPTSPDDMTLHGSALEACGMHELCACAGMVADEAGGP